MWKQLRCFGEFVEARRFHSAVLIGKYMVVVGGINTLGRFLKDINLLNLETLKW
jgi:hypothetical protein